MPVSSQVPRIKSSLILRIIFIRLLLFHTSSSWSTSSSKYIKVYMHFHINVLVPILIHILTCIILILINISIRIYQVAHSLANSSKSDHLHWRQKHGRSSKVEDDGIARITTWPRDWFWDFTEPANWSRFCCKIVRLNLHSCQPTIGIIKLIIFTQSQHWKQSVFSNLSKSSFLWHLFLRHLLPDAFLSEPWRSFYFFAFFLPFSLLTVPSFLLPIFLFPFSAYSSVIRNWIIIITVL